MRQLRKKWLGLCAVLTASFVFGTSCVVDAYRGFGGEFADIFIDVGRYDDDCCGWDDDCCGWYYDDDDDFDDFIEDFFDDVLDWD